MKTSLVGVALLSITTSMPALADVQYYEIVGTLNRLTTAAPLDLGLSNGMAFSGTLSYDPAALSCRPLTDNERQVCTSATTAPAWEISFGSFGLLSIGSQILIGPDYVEFYAGSATLLPLVYDGFVPLAQSSDTYLFFRNPTTSLNDSLPTSLST